MPLTEEQKAALAKQRGEASAKITDPEKKKAFIKRQGDVDAKGGDEKAYAGVKKEADETTATDAENINVGGMPHYSKGTDSVPKTGPAIVHKGEKITPADQNPDNKFTPAQRSEDTERDMLGKPQKFGAAMPDDHDGDDNDTAPPSGLTPGATDAPPAGDSVSLEHPTVTELKKQNAELEQRIADLEAQVGKKPAGPADQGMEYDEHGEEY